jgi:nucleotide-binding universal stress UspA family protein
LVDLVTAAGAEVFVVHVDDENSLPGFCDQIQHETEAFAHEFRARYLAGAPAARLELRIGTPADEILATADGLAADLLVMGWPHSEDQARGGVARDVLSRGRIRMVLVAVS